MTASSGGSRTSCPCPSTKCCDKRTKGGIPTISASAPISISTPSARSPGCTDGYCFRSAHVARVQHLYSAGTASTGAAANSDISSSSTLATATTTATRDALNVDKSKSA